MGATVSCLNNFKIAALNYTTYNKIIKKKKNQSSFPDTLHKTYVKSKTSMYSVTAFMELVEDEISKYLKYQIPFTGPLKYECQDPTSN